MGRQKTDDPLVPVPVRLPQSIVQEMRNEARKMGMTTSDVVRSRIENKSVKPLGRAKPRKRLVKGYAPKTDAELIRSISRLGNNLNQIGRWCNTYKRHADAVEVLFLLLSIEKEMKKLIAKDHAD